MTMWRAYIFVGGIWCTNFDNHWGIGSTLNFEHGKRSMRSKMPWRGMEARVKVGGMTQG